METRSSKKARLNDEKPIQTSLKSTSTRNREEKKEKMNRIMETLFSLKSQRDAVEARNKNESLFPSITEEEAKLTMDLYHVAHNYLMARFIKRTGRFGVSCTIAARIGESSKNRYHKCEELIVGMILEYKKAKEEDDAEKSMKNSAYILK